MNDIAETSGSGPLVSVLICVFNGESTIRRTLDSVVIQKYWPIELVIVDDGSTDATREVIENLLPALERRFCRVEVAHQENHGLVFSRRRALDLSVGEFIQFLDADDLLHEEKLVRSIDVFRETAADVVVSRTLIFSDDVDVTCEGSPILGERWAHNPSRDRRISGSYWHTLGPVFRRSALDHRWFSDVSVDAVNEEFYFHAQVKLSGARIVLIRDVLNFYRRGSAVSVTRSLDRLYAARIEAGLLGARLLADGRVKDRAQWSSLVLMAARTAFMCDSAGATGSLRDTSMAGLSAVIRSAPYPISYLMHLPYSAWRLTFRGLRGAKALGFSLHRRGRF